MGAPQARLSELANFSKKGIDVTILTAMPNYPAGKIYNGYGGFYKTEIIDGLKVISALFTLQIAAMYLKDYLAICHLHCHH